MKDIDLNMEEVSRYSRHLLLKDVGLKGQERLKAASVLCVGAGGLGSPVLLYLAAAGVGRIGVVDFDTVDVSNLQRQVLFDAHQVGEGKGWTNCVSRYGKARKWEVNPIESYGGVKHHQQRCAARSSRPT